MQRLGRLGTGGLFFSLILIGLFVLFPQGVSAQENPRLDIGALRAFPTYASVESALRRCMQSADENGECTLSVAEGAELICNNSVSFKRECYARFDDGSEMRLEHNIKQNSTEYEFDVSSDDDPPEPLYSWDLPHKIWWNEPGGNLICRIDERESGNVDPDCDDFVTDEDRQEIAQGAINTGECGPDIGCHLTKLPGYLFVAIGFLFLYLSGLILFLAGTVFNWVVLRTVFQFGEYFGTSEGMLIAWGVIRDIANIGLLFAFIFLGVMLILNVEGGGHGHHGGVSAKKAIPSLILFAVLLNFSLFATQFVIDIANAFGSTFTSLAGQTECEESVTGEEGNPADSQSLEDCATNVGISGRIIQAAGIAGIWEDDRRDLQSVISNLAGRPYSYAVSLIMLSIFVLVSAFVLLAGAIMLAVRVVVLSFLMVTSPIGFAGMVIPGLQKLAKQWWDTLIKQSFFAPVYLLLIFISLKLTEGLMNGQASLTNALIADQGNAISGNMQVVMIFFIVIGFMIASTITATKFGAIGAGFATKTAGGLTLGAAGFVGRRTVGRLGVAAASGIRSSKFGSTNTGRLFAGAADKVGASSFSLRNAVGSASGVDVGKANKTAAKGYAGIEKKLIEDRTAYAKSLTGRNETNSERIKRIAEENKEIAQRRGDAAQAVATSTAAEAAARTQLADAQAARDLQKTHRDNAEVSLAEQRARVAQNPADADAQRALVDMQRQFEREQTELAQAEQNLSQATQGLADAAKALGAARDEEAAARIATPRASVPLSAAQQQAEYASRLTRDANSPTRIIPGFVTAGVSVDRAAAKKILKEGSKSDMDKALEGVMKAAEAKANAAASNSHATPAAPKASAPAADPHH